MRGILQRTTVTLTDAVIVYTIEGETYEGSDPFDVTRSLVIQGRLPDGRLVSAPLDPAVLDL